MKRNVAFVLICLIFTLGLGTSSFAQKEEVPYAIFKDSILTLYYGNNKPVDAYGIRGDGTNHVWNTWFYKSTKIVIFDESFRKFRPISCADWFSGCENLVTIKGMNENLNTENVTDMRRMFKDCRSLSSIDVSSFDTDNVMYMSDMFSGCRRLMNLDLSNFNTEKVTDVARMFSGCRSLTSLDLSNFNTDNVTHMNDMFSGCRRLKRLDLSNFKTGKVYNMEKMFSGCSNLQTIFVVQSWKSSTYSDNMFSGCEALYGENGTKCVPEKVSGEFAHIDEGQFNPGYFTKKGHSPYKPIIDYRARQPYAVLENGVLTFRYDNQRPLRSFGMPTYGISWSDIAGDFTNVVFEKSFAKYLPLSLNSWFADCTELVEINGIENLNTVAVSDMSYMFSDCENLISLDLSSFNTEHVTDMRSMFGCPSLTSLDLSSFNTENVTDMRCMFECQSLTNLDLSSFNTENVTDMVGMFGNCHSLTSLDLSSFNTENVTDMRDMFYNCLSLINLNLSNFNTEKVYDMWSMFMGCESLTNLDLSNFKTDKVGRMGQMFWGCCSLTSLDLSNFNTANVWDMEYMFAACKSLTSLDLSSFNTKEDTRMQWMFSDCCNLQTIYVVQSWKSSTISADMFVGCEALCGEKGTKYAASRTNGELARIDKGKSNPGYFTQKGHSPYNSTIDYLACQPYAVLENDVLTFRYDNQRPYGAFDMPTSGFSWYDYFFWYNTNARNFDKVVFEKSFAKYFPTSLCNWFAGCRKLTAIEGIDNLNTDSVTDMSGMFKDCSKLTNLDVSNFNTSNVTDMSFMFENCGADSLDVSNFNTSNVTDMRGMFKYCSCTSLDVSNFNTSNVTDMSQMFFCYYGHSLDVSNFNTSNVTDMSKMFTGIMLESLDVSNFNTSNVTDMSLMFAENWLDSLDVSNFNTSNVTNMRGMFSDYYGDILDVSNFNTSNVTDMRQMFSYCGSLKTIYVGDGWNIGNVTESDNMFVKCTSLVGGKGSKCDGAERKDNLPFARIDGGPSAPGYFTKKE